MWWNISMKISQVESNAKIADSKFWIDETIHCKNLLIFCFSSHILISEPVRIYLECIQKSHYLYARIYFVNMSIEYNLWARKTVSKVLRQRMRTISSTSCLLRLPRWILFFFQVGSIYGELTDSPVEPIIVKFFGIFFLFFQSSSIWGNLISSAGKEIYILLCYVIQKSPILQSFIKNYGCHVSQKIS